MVMNASHVAGWLRRQKHPDIGHFLWLGQIPQRNASDGSAQCFMHTDLVESVRCFKPGLQTLDERRAGIHRVDANHAISNGSASLSFMPSGVALTTTSKPAGSFEPMVTAKAG